MNRNEAELVKKFIHSEETRSLSEVKLLPGYTKFMLYPTNDFWLTEGQFDVLKKFLKEIGEYEFYLTQFLGALNREGLYSEANKVYKFNLDSEYSSYYDLFLYSVPILFSSKGTWAILTDETFEAGYGLFISSEAYVEKFKKLYESVRTEYKEWLDDETYEESKKFYEELLVKNGVL